MKKPPTPYRMQKVNSGIGLHTTNELTPLVILEGWDLVCRDVYCFYGFSAPLV